MIETLNAGAQWAFRLAMLALGLALLAFAIRARIEVWTAYRKPRRRLGFDVRRILR